METGALTMRDWQFTEFFGFDACNGEFVLIDGFFYVVDIVGDQVFMVPAEISEAGA